MLGQGKSVRSPLEGEGVAETMCDELTAAPFSTALRCC